MAHLFDLAYQVSPAHEPFGRVPAGEHKLSGRRHRLDQLLRFGQRQKVEAEAEIELVEYDQVEFLRGDDLPDALVTFARRIALVCAVFLCGCVTPVERAEPPAVPLQAASLESARTISGTSVMPGMRLSVLHSL